MDKAKAGGIERLWEKRHEAWGRRHCAEAESSGEIIKIPWRFKGLRDIAVKQDMYSI